MAITTTIATKPQSQAQPLSLQFESWEHERAHAVLGYDPLFSIPHRDLDPATILWMHSIEDRSPYRLIDKGKGVEFREDKMDLGRPYPYRLGSVWFVAVRHSEDDGDVEIYHCSRENRG